MSRYQFTPQSEDDLFDIWSYIARDNLDAADRVEKAVFRACELLAASPLIGRVRKDVTHRRLRFWNVHPYSNYTIIYDPVEKPLQIVRIIHAAQDLSDVLR